MEYELDQDLKSFSRGFTVLERRLEGLEEGEWLPADGA